MNALDVIRQVEAHGGRLAIEHGELKVRAPEPLPDELVAALRSHKPSVMVALGVPLDQTVANVLNDLRPHLSPALQKLPDEKLLALVNWHIIHAWQRMLKEAAP